MKRSAVVKNIATVMFLLACLIVSPGARADDYNQASKLTFNQSIQIPGGVLPAGTYWFVLADTVNSRNMVQVFNADRSMLFATLFTVGVDRVTTTDNTAITFAEPEPMQPQAIVSWFYPGSALGHQFLYPKIQELKLAQVQPYTVVAMARQKHPSQNSAAGD
jgi:hypothetical protein